MNARSKLAAFGLVLAATFGGAFAVGNAVGPTENPPADEPEAPIIDGERHGEH